MNPPSRIENLIRPRPLSIMVNGREIPAYPGETVQAALTAAGYRSMRRAGPDDRRGVFCGMGVCYECLATINGVPGQRTCLTEVEDRMEVIIDDL